MVVSIIVAVHVTITSHTNNPTRNRAMRVNGNTNRVINANNRDHIVVTHHRKVLRNLNGNTNLLFRHNVTRTIANNGMVITVNMLLKLRSRRSRRAIIFTKTTRPPNINNLRNMVLHKWASHVVRYRCTSLYALTLLNRLYVRILGNHFNTTTRSINVVRRTLATKRVKRLNLNNHGNNKRGDHRTSNRRRRRNTGTNNGSFRHFRTGNSASYVPGELPDVLTKGPPASF